MDRRSFMVSMGAGVLTAPLAAEGQAPAKVARIGVIAFVYPKLFREGLRELGYVERAEPRFRGARGGGKEAPCP
jgi:hypothetical protein